MHKSHKSQKSGVMEAPKVPPGVHTLDKATTTHVANL